MKDKNTSAQNRLYYGNNLPVLRQHVADESVDLIYLDPPFNSSQDYNILFAEPSGKRSSAQVSAFEDTWAWDVKAIADYQEVVERGGKTSELLQTLRQFLGDTGMTAYLAVMAPRLIELRRVLKRTGSVYLHCDSTASHYLKLLMDAVFGPANFRTEIIWQRTGAHSDAKQGRRLYGRVHDTILFYSKSDEWTWNALYTAYDDEYVQTKYRYVEPGTGRRYRLDNLTGPGGAAKGNPAYEVLGITRHWRYSREKMNELLASGRIVQTRPGTVPQYKRYLDEMPGVPVGDVWTDIAPINSQAAERLGYPTQKPEALLERIIQASSNQGDVVLDPFCGCGTSVIAAQKLGRRWIGIDITSIATNLIKNRLRDTFGSEAKYEVVGEPVNLHEAQVLARTEPYQFEWWALGLVGARPTQSQRKKGADRGIDGRLFFHDEGPGGQTKEIVLQVKAGHLQPSHVRDLIGVVHRERAEIGALLSFEEPTRAMRSEAATAGVYESAWGRHPRIQLLTIKDLFAGKQLDYPRTAGTNVTFRVAQKVQRADRGQTDLFASRTDVVQKVDELLRREAGLSVQEAAARLIEALQSDASLALTVPRFHSGDSFPKWLRRISELIPPTALLHHATALRNRVVHEPEADWTHYSPKE